MEHVVGISEYKVSEQPDDTIITYSLGSCVALVLHDPVAGVGGMLHAMMPTAKSNPERASETPGMYTDAGASALLQAMFDRGATRATLVAKVVGAATHVDNDQLFRIGERNYAVLRKVLWKNGVLIAAEDVGGSISRTVYLDVSTGTTRVRSNGSINEL